MSCKFTVGWKTKTKELLICSYTESTKDERIFRLVKKICPKCHKQAMVRTNYMCKNCLPIHNKDYTYKFFDTYKKALDYYNQLDVVMNL